MCRANSFAVIGGGAWGTAIATHLAKNSSEDIILFLRNADIVNEINAHKINKKYFSDIVLPINICASVNFDEIYKYQYVIISVASSAFLEIVQTIVKKLNKNSIIIIATKGLDRINNQLFSESISKLISNPVVIMSGPSFAEYLIREKHTVMTLACKDINLVNSLANQLNSKYLTTYTCRDVITVQLAGIMKNIIAVASGITEGLDYGVNYKAWLISEGIKQIMDLAVKLGGKNDTCYQPSVIGDVVLSCDSMKSRNKLFGYQLAKAKDRNIFMKSVSYLVEGKENIFSILELAKKSNVSLSIPIAIAKIIQNVDKLEEIAQEYLVQSLKS